MQSPSPLEQPAEWPAEGRTRLILTFLFLLGLGAMSIGVGVAAAVVGLVGAIKYALLFAALFFSVATFGYLTRLRPTHHVTNVGTTTINGRPATEIKYSNAQFALMNVSMACVFLCCVSAAWDYGHADSGVFIPAIPISLAAAAAIFIASFFVLVVSGRLRRGRLLFASDGIHQEGRAFTSVLHWDSFTEVKPSHSGAREVLVIAYSNAPWQKHQLTGLWKLDKLPAVPMIEINTADLAIDPNVIYHLVRFYIENSEARDELGTSAARRRIQKHAF